MVLCCGLFDPGWWFVFGDDPKRWQIPSSYFVDTDAFWLGLIT
jgi:hypothetical protein